MTTQTAEINPRCHTSGQDSDGEANDWDRDQIEEMQRRAGLLKSLERMAGERRAKDSRFNSFDAKTPKQVEVRDTVKRWADKWDSHKSQGLVLYGPVGTGKDHLVYAAVRLVIIRHGASVRWVNGRDLAGDLRDMIDSSESERAFIRQYASPDILVVSDPIPPIGSLKEHQADMIYRIMEARNAAGKCTCVTLNAAGDDEADAKLGVATWDRMCDGAWKIRCAWASARKPAVVVE